MTTNMGSLPLLIAQAAFQEDQGHWHENEGFPITHFTFLLEKLRFLESFFLNFSKRDITKTWKFECRFQRSMFKNVRSGNTDQKCLLFGFLKTQLRDEINRTLLKF